MIRVELVSGLLVLGLGVFCLVEAITAPDDEVRNLPRWSWILLVLLFPLVGSVAWLAAGRPVATRPRGVSRAGTTGYPEYDRPGRAVASDPVADEEFLRQVRARAEEQRRRYRESRRAQEDETE